MASALAGVFRSAVETAHPVSPKRCSSLDDVDQSDNAHSSEITSSNTLAVGKDLVYV
jgi:hypothetical protein